MPKEMKAGGLIAGGKPQALPHVGAAGGNTAGGGQAEKFSGQSGTGQVLVLSAAGGIRAQPPFGDAGEKSELLA